MGLLPDGAAIRARLQRRSFWSLRYTDGRIVNEWEVDWSLVPARGRQSLRLYCPNGQVAELGNTADATGRLFQFNGAVVTAGSWSGKLYQLIGIVDGPDGECRCAAWDHRQQKLLSFRDNVHAMAYQGVGALSPDVLGIRP